EDCRQHVGAFAQKSQRRGAADAAAAAGNHRFLVFQPHGRQPLSKRDRSRYAKRAMNGSHPNNYPKLHNAAWPGVVGKGPDSEPPIDLDTMIDMTANAEVDGIRFDGIDL